MSIPMDSSSDEKDHAAKQLEVAEGLAQLFQSPQKPTPARREAKFTSIASALELDDLELSELSPDEYQQQSSQQQRGNKSPAGVSPSKRGRRRKRSASNPPVEGYEYHNPNREFYGDDEDKLDPDYEALISVSRKPGKNRARERPAVHAVQAQTELEVKELMRKNKQIEEAEEAKAGRRRSQTPKKKQQSSQQQQQQAVSAVPLRVPIPFPLTPTRPIREVIVTSAGTLPTGLAAASPISPALLGFSMQGGSGTSLPMLTLGQLREGKFMVQQPQMQQQQRQLTASQPNNSSPSPGFSNTLGVLQSQFLTPPLAPLRAPGSAFTPIPSPSSSLSSSSHLKPLFPLGMLDSLVSPIASSPSLQVPAMKPQTPNRGIITPPRQETKTSPRFISPLRTGETKQQSPQQPQLPTSSPSPSVEAAAIALSSSPVAIPTVAEDQKQGASPMQVEQPVAGPEAQSDEGSTASNSSSDGEDNEGDHDEEDENEMQDETQDNLTESESQRGMPQSQSQSQSQDQAQFQPEWKQELQRKADCVWGLVQQYLNVEGHENLTAEQRYVQSFRAILSKTAYLHLAPTNPDNLPAEAKLQDEIQALATIHVNVVEHAMAHGKERLTFASAILPSPVLNVTLTPNGPNCYPQVAPTFSVDPFPLSVTSSASYVAGSDAEAPADVCKVLQDWLEKATQIMPTPLRCWYLLTAFNNSLMVLSMVKRGLQGYPSPVDVSQAAGLVVPPGLQLEEDPSLVSSAPTPAIAIMSSQDRASTNTSNAESGNTPMDSSVQDDSG